MDVISILSMIFLKIFVILKKSIIILEILKYIYYYFTAIAIKMKYLIQF